MALRRGLFVIVLLLLFLLPLLFFDTTRSFAQGPYPSATPNPSVTQDPAQCGPIIGTCYSLSFICSNWGMSLNPGKICPANQKCCVGATPAPTVVPSTTPLPIDQCGGGNLSGLSQGAECYQTSQCTGCGAGISYSCHGFTYGPPQTCGHCFCTDPDPNPIYGNCSDWTGCGWEDPPGAFCEERFCDVGCTCQPGLISTWNCCSFQIQCPCALPTGAGGGPSATPGGGGPPPATSTPVATSTPAGTCGPLWYCNGVYQCVATEESFNDATHQTCPAAYTCEAAYGTCFNQQAACQSACVSPSPTGPTQTPSSTPVSVPLYCTIGGNKYIDDIAGPVGLCDDPSEHCSPATDNNMTLDDMHPILPNMGTDSTNPYAFPNMDADSNSPAYRVRPDTAGLPGFSTAFAIPPGAPASADHVDFACPVYPPQTTATKTFDWYYTPQLGSVRIEAKKSDTVSCTGVDGFDDLAGVEVSLARQGWSGDYTNPAELKSYAFDNGNPSTYQKAAPGTFSNVVQAQFNHSVVDPVYPPGWVKQTICWVETADPSNVLQTGNSFNYLSDAPGVNEVTAYIVYTPPTSWTQTATCDIRGNGLVYHSSADINVRRKIRLNI